MILTEETHYGINQCTMESSRAGNEEPYFGRAGSNNEVVQTRTTKPPRWNSNATASVSKLSALGLKAGPNVLLKVMAGDQISATTNYYYQNPVTNGTGNNLTGPIITSLVQSILGSPATGLAKGNTTPISANLNANTDFINKTAPDASNPNGSNPKAYLTIVFFNERFEFVSEGSTALRVTQSGDNAVPLVIPNVKAPKNGYAYVYLSNESNEPVYFDDFKVTDTRGRIIEENHYYAFGLRTAGISSRKFGDDNYEGELKNNYLYNDKEVFDDADLDWYDYGFRNYDPQIGRFPQLDPLTDNYPELTPYQYASNDPIANVDMDGLEKLPAAVADFTYGYTRTSAAFVFPTLTKAAAPVTKTFSALNIGLNTIKIGAAIRDKTIVKTLVKNSNISRMQAESYFGSLMNKMGNWLDRVSHGTGSYQDYGIVFTGNDNGTMEFRDHAGTILDHIDIGPLFGTLKAFGLDPKVFKELLSSPGGLKYVAHLLEADKTVLETHETVKEAIKATSSSKIDPVFTKKGNIVYRRYGGLKTRVLNKKGSAQITDKPATDTFPKNEN